MDRICSLFVILRLVLLLGMPIALSGCGDNEWSDQNWPIPPEPIYSTGDSYAGEPVAGRSGRVTPDINRNVITREPLVVLQNPVDLRSRALPSPISPLASPTISYRTQRAESHIQDTEGRIVYTVRPGDTLYSISRSYGISVQDIATHNSLPSLNDIFDNQRLVIPVQSVKKINISSRISRASPVPSFSQQYANIELPMLRPSDILEDIPIKHMRSSFISSRAPMVAPGLKKTHDLSLHKFRWPVRGRILFKFGILPSGARNDGINISVPAGASIKASAGGVVAYAGDDLKGYGQLILIRHKEDWVTAYAHNSKIMVRRGDKVRRGEIVAKAGKTGNVDQPQLHFEIRHGSRPIDPLALFLEG